MHNLYYHCRSLNYSDYNDEISRVIISKIFVYYTVNFLLSMLLCIWSVDPNFTVRNICWNINIDTRKQYILEILWEKILFSRIEFDTYDVIYHLVILSSPSLTILILSTTYFFRPSHFSTYELSTEVKKM